MFEHAPTLYGTAAVVSGLAGLAALLRSEAVLTWLKVATVLLNSSLLGLGLAMVWQGYFKENPNVLVGLCILLGLGGQPTLEWVVGMVRRGGFSINLGDGNLRVRPNDDKEDKDKGGSS